MTDQEKIADLETRLAKAEREIAELKARPVQYVPYPYIPYPCPPMSPTVIPQPYPWWQPQFCYTTVDSRQFFGQNNQHRT